MSLRILGGSFRNRLLNSPKGEQTRPTLAIMRQAVFDILQSDIENAQFLDLFAGSGAMGFEALSRGASHVTFVDSNKLALRCIHENIQQLEVDEQCSVLGYDCLLALKRLAKDQRRFDVIYIDPPYAAAQRTRILNDIFDFFESHTLFNAGGTLFCEESAPPSLKPESLSLKCLKHVNTRIFSRSALHQFRMTD